MKIFTLHGRGDLHQSQPIWLEMKPLSPNFLRIAKRTIKRIGERLPCEHILVHRTERLLRPPREIEIEIYKVEKAKNRIVIEELSLGQSHIDDWKDIFAGLSTISQEISERWPEGARPDELALITDGKSLWFNPDEPQNHNGRWIELHFGGNVPSTMIYSKTNTRPLSEEWFAES